MLNRIVALSVASVLLSDWAYAGQQSGLAARNPLPGVWRVVEATRDSAGKHVTRRAQPGLYIFTEQHYSINRVDSSEPRRPFPGRLRRTADTYLDTWGPFTAQAGMYAVHGSYITTRAFVAKRPENMKRDNYRRLTWRMAGDTLWLHLVADESGRIRGGPRFKLVRAE